MIEILDKKNSKEIVVSDASPIINLEKIDEGFSYLSKFFLKVLIPKQVLLETVKKTKESPQDYLKRHGIDDIVEIHETPLHLELQEITSLTNRKNNTFKGEAFALSLAYNKDLLLLMNDKRAIKIADKNDIKVLSLEAYAIRAFMNNIITFSEADTLRENSYKAFIIGEKENIELKNLLLRAREKMIPTV